MKKSVSAIASVAILVATMMIGVNAVCPPPGYDSVEPFSLEAYVADGTPWYVQEQVPISYQPESSLYCVRARYTELANGRINVDNSARVGSIEGAQQNAGGFQLNAVVPNPAEPSKLAVGPPFLPPITYGPYWVVAAGPYSPDDAEWTGEYEWAIITGGAPGQVTANDKCIGTGNFQNEGFWLFTREQVASPELVEEMRVTADSLGLDIELLVPVAQEGCVYEPEPEPVDECLEVLRICTTDEECCSGNCDWPAWQTGLLSYLRFFTPQTCRPTASPIRVTSVGN